MLKKSFPQPVTLTVKRASDYVLSQLNTKPLVWDVSFPEKFLKKFNKPSRSQNFDYSKCQNFTCRESLGVAAYRGAFQINSIQLNQKLRFGGLVFEKTKKNFRKNGQLFRPQTFSKAEDNGGSAKRPEEYAATQNLRRSFYGYPFLKLKRSLKKINNPIPFSFTIPVLIKQEFYANQ